MKIGRQRMCMMVASVALLGAASRGTGGSSTVAGVIVLLLYIAPTVVAFSRHAQKRREAAALSLLLGFLIVPWIIALIWAFGPTAEEQALEEKQRALAQQQQVDAHEAAIHAFMRQDLQPVDAGSVVLRAGETCYFAAKANEVKEVKQRTRVGGYAGPSVRVARGVYWHMGGVASRTITSGQAQVVDTGTLYLTNKRAVFVGAAGTIDFHYEKIGSFEPFTDGLRIDMPNKPFVLFMTGTPEAAWTFGRLKDGAIRGYDSIKAASAEAQTQA